MMTCFCARTYTWAFAVLLAYAFLFFSLPSKVSAAYNGGRLIDNSTFLNAASMNPNSIQSFLASKGGGLAGQTFTFDCASTGAQSSAAYQAAGAPCGQTASAAQIIYYAAQVYGINPRVILATLQKEQSLITTPNPTSWQINQAMGFGCGDSSGCSSSNFLYQIDNGTWVLRINFERARGNMTYWFTASSWVCGTTKNYYSPNLYPNQSVNFRDGNGTLYATLWLSSAATSSLYCYTPHAYNNPSGLYGLPIMGTTGQYYSGSYYFVYYFEKWFGSTLGSLWRTAENGTLYYVDGSQKFIISTPAMMDQYGLTSQDIRFVSQAELDAMPLASAPLSPYLGQLVKSPSDADADGGTVYFIDSGRRIPIASMGMLAAFGYTSANISYLPLDNIYRLPSANTLSAFVRDPSLTAFQMDNGKKRIFFELTKYTQTSSGSTTTDLSSFSLSQFPFGQPQIDGSYLIVGPDGTIRLYNGSEYQILTSMDTFDCWGFGSGMRIYRMPSYDPVNGTSRGSLSCISKDSSNTTYLMNGTSKYTMPSASLPTTSPNDDVISRIPTATLPLALQAPNGEISVYESSLRRALPSMLTFTGIGLTGPDIGRLQAGAYYALPSGALKLAPGNLIVDSSGTVSVVSASGTRYALNSAQLFNDYGFKWHQLIKVTDSSTLSAYPTASNLNRMVASGGSAYLLDGGNKYLVDPSLYTAYGINLSNLQSLDSQILSYSTAKTASKFITPVTGGTIYYLNAGSKQPITSWQRFLDLGGSGGSIMRVSGDTLQLFSTGSTL